MQTCHQFFQERTPNFCAPDHAAKGKQDLKTPNFDDSIKELEALIKDLEHEENLGNMDKNDLFLSTNKMSDANAENASANKLIGKPMSADGVFSNIKHNIRQSNKKRIEVYANTNAKVVKESNMEPLKLQQYTEK